jgi:hypothetical protein
MLNFSIPYLVYSIKYFGCGSVVEKPVVECGYNQKSYSQIPQAIFIKVQNALFIPFLFTNNKQALHTFFMNFNSVSFSFYTLSTVPTITTTYINKKGL